MKRFLNWWCWLLLLETLRWFLEFLRRFSVCRHCLVNLFIMIYRNFKSYSPGTHWPCSPPVLASVATGLCSWPPQCPGSCVGLELSTPNRPWNKHKYSFHTVYRIRTSLLSNPLIKAYFSPRAEREMWMLRCTETDQSSGIDRLSEPQPHLCSCSSYRQATRILPVWLQTQADRTIRTRPR